MSHFHVSSAPHASLIRFVREVPCHNDYCSYTPVFSVGHVGCTYLLSVRRRVIQWTLRFSADRRSGSGATASTDYRDHSNVQGAFNKKVVGGFAHMLFNGCQ